MRDVAFVLMVIAFFAVASAYVRACASVVGPEPSELDEPGGDEELAA
ncbi:MAG: hypothetical protein ACT4PW_03920 [Acidimicrobiia bacterium]